MPLGCCSADAGRWHGNKKNRVRLGLYRGTAAPEPEGLTRSRLTLTRLGGGRKPTSQETHGRRMGGRTLNLVFELRRLAMEFSHLRMNQIGEIPIAHLHGPHMAAGVEHDGFILCQRRIDIDRR